MNKLYFMMVMLSFTVACQKAEKKTSNVEHKDSLYSLTAFNQTITVNSKMGGRIISFKKDSSEIIGNGGSTFWTSPQSSWGWPPVKAHNDLPYSANIKNDTLVFTSSMDKQMGLEVVKTIFANSKDSSFTVQYKIVNKTDTLVSVAPWENTRTFKSALVFYPKGETDSTAFAEVMGDLKLSHSDGINWFTYDSLRILYKPMAKLFADGKEGWIAEAYNGLILIKKFKDISIKETAPGEGEIEVFSDHENPFTEMEQQGPYQVLKPGESLQWDVKWYLRSLPKDIKEEEGNLQLVQFVREVVK